MPTSLKWIEVEVVIMMAERKTIMIETMTEMVTATSIKIGIETTIMIVTSTATTARLRSQCN
jgi:hypothetical protein